MPGKWQRGVRAGLVVVPTLAGLVLTIGVNGAAAQSQSPSRSQSQAQSQSQTQAQAQSQSQSQIRVMHASQAYYLPLDSSVRPPDFSYSFAAGGSGSDEERTLKDVKAVIDASDLKGKAELQTHNSSCTLADYVATCSLGDFYQRTDLAPFTLKPAAGAKKGETGAVRLTVTSSNAPAVHHTTRFVVGAPKLTARQFKPLDQVAPGAEISFRPAFGNSGEVPLDEGVSLQVTASGATLEARYGNCRYDRLDAPTIAQCDFPKGLPVGAAREVADAFKAKVGKTAMGGSIGVYLWGVGSPPEYLGLDAKAPHGTGAPLTLRSADGSGFGADSAHLEFRTTQTSDRKAVGFTIKGKVGHVVTTQVPFPVTAGPGTAGGAAPRAASASAGDQMRLTLPEGTTLVPLGPDEQDEALYCAYDKGGERDRKAVCPFGPDGFGTKLRVRIDKRVEGARGSITVPYDPATDPDEKNNTAPILMAYTDAAGPDGDSGATAGSGTGAADSGAESADSGEDAQDAGNGGQGGAVAQSSGGTGAGGALATTGADADPVRLGLASGGAVALGAVLTLAARRLRAVRATEA
ncbi:hypothetical protein [Streptomyces sp. NPDC052496]|uniref:hypothetical protein n=1 Tax=Streptomyces sp. NPDC052496 TaxID=3154951 RepID=UPI003448305A